MDKFRMLFLVASIITCFLIQAQGADEYTDEKRPYEFGFSIAGQQHRHEKKDKNGIIMGEFGFITADDVYHVTVYATDENGHFKIISMKNIHLKSQATTSARQGHALQLPPTQKTPASQAPPVSQTPTQKPQEQFEPISLEPPANSCSHCSLPPTSTQAPVPPIIPPVNQPSPGNSIKLSYFGTAESGSPQYPQQSIATSSNPSQQNGNNAQYPQSLTGQNNPDQYISQGPGTSQNYPQQQLNAEQSFPQIHGNSQSSPNQGASAQPSPQELGLSQNYPEQPVNAEQTYPHIPGSGQNYPQSGFNSGQSYPQGSGGASNYPATKEIQNNPQNSVAGQPNNYNSSPQYSTVVPGAAQGAAGLSYGQNYPGQGSPAPQNYPQVGEQSQQNEPQSASPVGSRTPKQYNGLPQQALGTPSVGQQYYPQNGAINGPGALEGGQQNNQKPTLAYAQMQVVGKNTDIYAKRPGEQEGLPKGLTKDDMVHLLYTFNYTLGFQGHFEEGYTNGVKHGYYYVTGRNGVRTRVDYVADDKGFRPKITQEVLDLVSDDVPKPETERDAKYGLKGYEFKWLYYPVESKA